MTTTAKIGLAIILFIFGIRIGCKVREREIKDSDSPIVFSKMGVISVTVADTLPEGVCTPTYTMGAYALGVDSSGNVLFPVDTIPLKTIGDIMITGKDTNAVLMSFAENYFTIVDSSITVASRNIKTGQWIIADCQRALEVVYQLDSIRWAEYKNTNKNK